MSEHPSGDGPPAEDGRTDPTAPLPYPEQYSQPEYPQQPAANPYETNPYDANPYDTNPYGSAPYGSTPYAADASGASAPPPYGAPQSPYGTPPPAYYQSTPSQSNTSALVLTIVSALGTLSCCLPLPALILGIIALTKQSTDPEQSARLSRYGWITFGVMVGLAVLAFVAIIAFGVVTSPTSVDYGY